jgi:hypothetical protein
MSVVLLIIGLLATAAGLVTIGFGIPINAFSLGNTLIIAGTIAVAAGLILIGLAAAIGQLRRIAEGLNARQLTSAGRSTNANEVFVPPAVRAIPTPAPPAVSTRTPPSPRQPEIREQRLTDEPDQPEARQPDQSQPELHPSMLRRPVPRQPIADQPESRSPATAKAGELPGPLDWLRARSKLEKPASSAAVASNEAEPPMPPPDELALQPKIWTPHRGNGLTESRPSRTEQSPIRAERALEQPNGQDGFDSVWPDRAAAAPSHEPAKHEAGFDMPLPPIPSRPGERKPTEIRAEISPKPASERGPAVLKSGVIDGMPYTLYADCSIEAALPTGTVKFASVDELRAHLEKQS